MKLQCTLKINKHKHWPWDRSAAFRNTLETLSEQRTPLRSALAQEQAGSGVGGVPGPAQPPTGGREAHVFSP